MVLYMGCISSLANQLTNDKDLQSPKGRRFDSHRGQANFSA